MASEDVLHRYAAMLLSGGSNRTADAAMMEALAAEVRELRRDKARLDWMLSNPNVDVSFAQSSLAVAVLDTRHEIDAAMEATENG